MYVSSSTPQISDSDWAIEKEPAGCIVNCMTFVMTIMAQTLLATMRASPMRTTHGARRSVLYDVLCCLPCAVPSCFLFNGHYL
jgi:hypothetical protein